MMGTAAGVDFSTPESARDIAARFTYRRVESPARQNALEVLHSGFRDVARRVDELVPPGRHKELALTALEEALHWLRAAVECAEAEPVDPVIAGARVSPEDLLQRLAPGARVSLGELQAARRAYAERRRAERGGV